MTIELIKVSSNERNIDNSNQLIFGIIVVKAFD